MRSEERSGIIAIVLILLWGTLATEPFRYFAGITGRGIDLVLSKAGIVSGGKICVLITSAVIVALTVGLLLFSKKEFGKYVAPIAVSIDLLVFLIGCLRSGSVNIKMAIVLIVSVVIILLIYIIKLETAWVWLSDAFILSFPVFLVSSWLFVPISKISTKVGKFFFIAFKSTEDYAAAFKGLFSIPKLIWGIFFVILLMLPVLYFIPERRKA